MNSTDGFVLTLQNLCTPCLKTFSYININGQASKINHLEFMRKNSHACISIYVHVGTYIYKNIFNLLS